MPKHYFILLILSSLFLMGCKNKNPSGNSAQKPDHSNAIPDAISEKDRQLSNNEKNSLANAAGRSVEIIALNDLDAMFEASEERLHVYSFWKNHSLNCGTVNQALLQLQKEIGDSTMRLIFFNLDDTSKITQVNAFIREHGVTSNVFVTSDTLTMDWYNQIDPSWSGEVPAIYLKNKSDGTDLFYQKNFTAEELSVLIQPFTL